MWKSWGTSDDYVEVLTLRYTMDEECENLTVRMNPNDQCGLWQCGECSDGGFSDFCDERKDVECFDGGFSDFST